MSEGDKTMEKKLLAATNGRQSTAGCYSAADFNHSSGCGGAKLSTVNYVATSRRDAAGVHSNFDVGSAVQQQKKGSPSTVHKSVGGGGSGRRERVPQGTQKKQEVTKAGLGEPFSAEYGSVQAWGHKKNSKGNHLLNFHFDSHGSFDNRHVSPREHHQGRENRRAGASMYGQTRVAGYFARHAAPAVCYNKERFLQANCQFIVREGADYSLHSTDPDTLVNWDLIEQVCVLNYEVQSCPICLYPPRAAKMTRCGHIYCWSCMLHYLSLDDRKWSKCPICYESIHEKDLKSVRVREMHEFSVGDVITMKLMKKSRGDLHVAPRLDWKPYTGRPCLLEDTCLGMYAKLLSADMTQVRDILRGERLELEEQLREEGENSLEGSFITAALKSLDERERSCEMTGGHVDKLLGLCVKSDHTVLSAGHTELMSTVYKGGEGRVVVRKAAHKQYRSAFSDDEMDVKDEHEDEPCLVSSSPEAVTFDVGDSTLDLTGAGMRDGMSDEYSDKSSVNVNSITVNDSDSEHSQCDRHSVCECTGSDKTCSIGQHCEEQCQGAVRVEYRETLTGTAGGKMVEGDERVEGAEGTVEHRSNIECDQSAFYFYQAEDGQHIYMNPLNVRCMLSQYGSLSQAPDCITATILELEAVSMDENVRRRLRVLNHLPLTCQFVMAELDLKPPIISQAVLKQFADEIERRNKARQRKARDDRQRARRIEMEENRRLGIDPTVRVIRSDYKSSTSVTPCNVVTEQRNNNRHDNGCQSEMDSAVSAGVCAVTSDEAVTDGTVSDSSLASPRHLKTTSSAPSFAQMLKVGQQRRAVIQASGQQDRRSDTSGQRRLSATEEDDVTTVPSYEDSWATSIQAALDSLAVHRRDDEEDEEQAGAGAGGSKKKKKKVKKLLFTTSMARHN